MERSASITFSLFSWWQTVPPGVGVPMSAMLEAVDVKDPQAIRMALTRLRKGKVPDPTERGAFLRPLPIRFNPADRRYYDLSRMSADAVVQQVPGTILAGAMGHLLTRASTLNSSMGSDGLVRSARELLNDPETHMLIGQLPFDAIWKAQDVMQQIARARQLLMIEGGQVDPKLETDEAERSGR